jgi:hypothetical protein
MVNGSAALPCDKTPLPPAEIPGEKSVRMIHFYVPFLLQPQIGHPSSFSPL